MKELEEKQRALSKQADTFDERMKELRKVLDQVKAGMFTTYDHNKLTFCLDYICLNSRPSPKEGEGREESARMPKSRIGNPSAILSSAEFT